MDIRLCLNPNSFPATSCEQAYQLFEDCWQGVLALNQGSDRYFLYLDTRQSNELDDFSLAESFTYKDFLNLLLENKERELYRFLMEMESKSPALDHLDDGLLEDITSYKFYMSEYAVTDSLSETLSLAYFLDAILLSINTSSQWDNHQIDIARIEDDGRYIDEKLMLHHIARQEHGELLFDLFDKDDVEQLCNNTVLTDEFRHWYQGLSDENKRRVKDKLRLACQERLFQGGEPLFKTLSSSDGIREIRFRAYSGGAIRILFKVLNEAKHAILLGFIKKSNSEGYDEKISKAEKLFAQLQAS